MERKWLGGGGPLWTIDFAPSHGKDGLNTVSSHHMCRVIAALFRASVDAPTQYPTDRTLFLNPECRNNPTLNHMLVRRALVRYMGRFKFKHTGGFVFM